MQIKWLIGGVLTLQIVLFSTAQNTDLISTDINRISCECEQSIVYDNSLPASHPTNLCAANIHKNTTWLGWLQGKSRSTEFHFLDLLELIWHPYDAVRPQQPQPSHA